MKIERKSLPFEVEEKGLDPEARTIKGYAAITGNVDDYGDIIDAGAFKKTLQEQGGRVKVYYIHDFWEPIGRPIEMKEVTRKQLPSSVQDEFPDATGGLFVHFSISETTRGNDALTLARDGVLDELSIGFRTVKDEDEELENGMTVRHIKELSLIDISPVPMAANAGAIITDVKLAKLAQEVGDDVGMDAETVLRKFMEFLAQSEVDLEEEPERDTDEPAEEQKGDLTEEQREELEGAYLKARMGQIEIEKELIEVS